MKQINVQLTPNLLKAIDAVCGDVPRNRHLEEWLWEIPEIRKAAKRLKLKRQPRPTKPGPVPRMKPPTRRTRNVKK